MISELLYDYCLLNFVFSWREEARPSISARSKESKQRRRKRMSPVFNRSRGFFSILEASQLTRGTYEDAKAVLRVTRCDKLKYTPIVDEASAKPLLGLPSRRFRNRCNYCCGSGRSFRRRRLEGAPFQGCSCARVSVLPGI